MFETMQDNRVEKFNWLIKNTQLDLIWLQALPPYELDKVYEEQVHRKEGIA